MPQIQRDFRVKLNSYTNKIQHQKTILCRYLYCIIIRATLQLTEKLRFFGYRFLRILFQKSHQFRTLAELKRPLQMTRMKKGLSLKATGNRKGHAWSSIETGI